MSDEDVLEETPTHRVRLLHDADCPNPRNDRDTFAGALTFPRDTRRWLAIPDPGPLEDRWRELVDRRGEDDAARIVERHVRRVGGAAEYDSPTEGPSAVWYCLPEQAVAAGFAAGEGVALAGCCAQIVADERAEYRAWAEGDCWGYVVEAKLHWQRTTPTAGWVPEPAEEMDTWEEVDSCWGFIGREWAETSAREALAAQAPAVTA